jgi:hypothetical protein
VPDERTYSGPYGSYSLHTQMVAEGLTVPAHQYGTVTPPSIQVVIDECERLRALLARTRAEGVATREVNETLRRERVEVEQALGRSIHAGELGPAVRMALYRETGR